MEPEQTDARFLGKNGAGKTTTIKILCGLMRPNSGSARVMGHDVRSRDARKLVGYLPENPYFYEYLTPKETIEFYGRLRGLDKTERAREWDRLSEQLDLRDIGNQRVRGFSKGMRQRLGFAVALVGNPPVLILDEPMSGLDPMGRRRIRDLIVTLRDQKKTIFFSSHVLSDVELISDRVGMLVNGKLHRQGVMDDLLATRVHLVEVVARGIPDHIVSQLVAKARISGFISVSPAAPLRPPSRCHMPTARGHRRLRSTPCARPPGRARNRDRDRWQPGSWSAPRG